MASKKEAISKEDVLTAVVLADPYTSHFNPLTPSNPHCLMSLAGRPLLDYTFESLFMNGVKEVILYLSNGPNQVRTWLGKSRWNQNLPMSCRPMNISVIVNEDCRSVGDACRDLDEKGIVRGEFLLVSGDLIANVKLEEIIEKHRARSSKDKNSIMTKVYMKAQPGNQLRVKGSEVVLGCDKTSNQILFYQRSGQTSYNFPVELFQHDEISICYDLGDPEISVCSPNVLSLFSDNFDIQDMDTLTNEILESDLVDSTIYMETLVEGTAARASSPYMLLTLSNMILSKWFFPIVPPSKLFTASRFSIYQGKNCKIGKGSLLEEEVLLGHGSVLASNCSITRTSIGENCIIGDDCVLIDCVIEDNAKISDGVTIQNCIIGKNAVIPKGVTIGEKVIIGSGVEFKEGVSVPEGSRFIANDEDDWGDDDTTETGDSASIWGPKAFIFKDDDADDDESVASGIVNHDTWGEIFYTDDENSSDESCVEESDQEFDNMENASEEEEEDGEHEDVKNFRREVIDSIGRGLEQGVTSDNLVLEINGSKHAWNITLSEVNQCVLYAVLTANISFDENLTASSLLPCVQKNINTLKQLLLKYSKSKSGQEYYLQGILSLVERHPIFLDVLAKVLHILYDKDVLSDEAIISWHKKLLSGSSTTENSKALFSKLKPLIEWLEQSDSESDED